MPPKKINPLKPNLVTKIKGLFNRGFDQLRESHSPVEEHAAQKPHPVIKHDQHHGHHGKPIHVHYPPQFHHHGVKVTPKLKPVSHAGPAPIYPIDTFPIIAHQVVHSLNLGENKAGPAHITQTLLLHEEEVPVVEADINISNDLPGRPSVESRSSITAQRPSTNSTCEEISSSDSDDISIDEQELPGEDVKEFPGKGGIFNWFWN